MVKVTLAALLICIAGCGTGGGSKKKSKSDGIMRGCVVSDEAGETVSCTEADSDHYVDADKCEGVGGKVRGSCPGEGRVCSADRSGGTFIVYEAGPTYICRD